MHFVFHHKIQDDVPDIVQLSVQQKLIVFGLKSGVIGVIQIESANPNFVPSVWRGERDNISNSLNLCPQVVGGRGNMLLNQNSITHNRKCKQKGRSPFNDLQLQIFETLKDMTVTAITIGKTKRCFYVGTSCGIISLFSFMVSLVIL